MQRGREVGSGAGIGEALAQLGCEVTLGQPAYPLKSPRGTLAGADGKSQQLGDSRELGQHLLLTLVRRPRQHLVASHDARADRDEDEQHQGDDRAAVLDPHQRGYDDSTQTANDAPHDLLGTEALDIGSKTCTLHPPPDRRRAAQQPLNASTEVTEHGAQDLQQPRQAVVTANEQEARRPGGVPKVWRETGFQPRAPVCRKPDEDKEAADGHHRTERGAEP